MGVCGARACVSRSGLWRLVPSHTVCFPYGAPCDLKEPGEVDAFIHLLRARGQAGSWKMEMRKSPALQNLTAHIQGGGLAGTGHGAGDTCPAWLQRCSLQAPERPREGTNSRAFQRWAFRIGQSTQMVVEDGTTEEGFLPPKPEINISRQRIWETVKGILRKQRCPVRRERADATVCVSSQRV